MDDMKIVALLTFSTAILGLVRELIGFVRDLMKNKQNDKTENGGE